MNIIKENLLGIMEDYMNFLTTVEMSSKWGISSRRISLLCAEGRIDGAIKKGKTWLVPEDAKKPEDKRRKRNVEGI